MSKLELKTDMSFCLSCENIICAFRGKNKHDIICCADYKPFETFRIKCRTCRKYLTKEEIKNYENFCEKCESIKPKVNEIIKTLVDSELKRCEKYGANFHSDHEAESVLREEIEELFQEYMDITDAQVDLWNSVKNNNSDIFLREIKNIEESATNAILEAAQIVAVCRKAQRGFI